MQDFAINIPPGGLIILGFALGWLAGIVGVGVKMIVRADKGGDPHV